MNTGGIAKPGIRTSEFWATILTHLFTIATSAYALAGQPFPDRLAGLQVLVPVAGLVASAGVQAAYSLARGRVKESMVQVLGTWDDAEAVWDALFPDKPTPPSIQAATRLKRAEAVEGQAPARPNR